MIHYVIILALTPSFSEVATLIKRSGPPALIGKICFPGGKLEAGEIPSVAASRELREETGVHIDAEDLIRISFVNGDDYKISVFTGTTPDVLKATTKETEKVTVVGIEQALADPSLEDKYCPEFEMWLKLAKAALHAKQKSS